MYRGPRCLLPHGAPVPRSRRSSPSSPSAPSPCSVDSGTRNRRPRARSVALRTQSERSSRTTIRRPTTATTASRLKDDDRRERSGERPVQGEGPDLPRGAARQAEPVHHPQAVASGAAAHLANHPYDYAGAVHRRRTTGRRRCSVCHAAPPESRTGITLKLSPQGASTTSRTTRTTTRAPARPASRRA